MHSLSTKTSIEEVPDVDDSVPKHNQKLRRSARVTAHTKGKETTPVPDALTLFVNALNSAALDSGLRLNC